MGHRAQAAPGGHLWFLYNLTAYTLLCLPLYALRPRIETAAVPAPVLVAAMAAGATVVFVLAKPFASAIAGDGHQFPWYLWIFASGYVLGARHREVIEWLARRA